MGDSYDFWKACRQNGTYEAEKQRVAEAFIRELAQQYPQTKGKVAVWDVATPLTYERYLGSYKGSWMSLTRKDTPNVSYPSKPESIQRVYFAGQRQERRGGLPVALVTGRTAVSSFVSIRIRCFSKRLKEEGARSERGIGFPLSLFFIPFFILWFRIWSV